MKKKNGFFLSKGKRKPKSAKNSMINLVEWCIKKNRRSLPSTRGKSNTFKNLKSP